MKEFIMKNLFEIISSLSILTNLFLAVYFGLKTWSKSRSVYKLEKYKFPKNVGDSKDVGDLRHEKALNEKLSTGEYQIEHIYDKDDRELMIVLGRVKNE